jgi:hypothetical protein
MDMIESESELLACLDALGEFERVHSLFSRFNLFEAVNMARQEIRHSRFLAYLLEPSQSHGLDDRFLRAVIMAAADNHADLRVSKLHLAIADYSNARVYCERDHFDISVEVPDLELLFVIENKIGSDEHEDQLKGYREKAKALYPKHLFFGCFLTAEGYDGDDAEWARLSYTDIARALKKLSPDGALRPDVKMAIDHYVELIEKRIMPSKELIEACRQLYRQHRTALDLIYEHGVESMLDQAYAEFRRSHGDVSPALLSRKGFLSFVPTTWNHIPGFDVADTSKSKWELACPIKFWFQTTEQKVSLKLEVGPVDSTKAFDRSDFVTRLRVAFGENPTKRKGDSYTRVWNKSVKVDADAGVDELAECLGKLWKQVDSDQVIAKVAAIAKECLKASTAAPTHLP